MAWHNDQVSERETEKIVEIARDQLEIPGDYVEFGCYKGDTSLMLAEVLRDGHDANCGKLVEKPKKRLWIYDSFEGLPEKNAKDESVLGRDFKGGELFVTKREVKERFLRAGLPVPVIKKAWFNELSDADLPGKISFAFLDGDFYESIMDSLKLAAPRMVEGGVVVVHDYGNPALPGVRKAVEEWERTNAVRKELYQSMIIMRY